MAHKKAGGSTRNGRDSKAKRLGVKLSQGQLAKSGAIIIRQKGTKYFPGEGTQMGVDYTIFAVKEGRVAFYKRNRTRFDSQVHEETFVAVK